MGDLLRALVTVFLAELPDKTMFATVVLVARYHRPWSVWLGAGTAFALHVIVAVAAGRLISRAPADVVQTGVAVLFGLGAIWLFRSARSAAAASDDEVVEVVGASAWQAFGGSFALIAVAEWGDLTQLATAGLAARSGAPLATGLGAWFGLLAVAGLAAAVGRQLVRRVPIHRLNYVAAALFAGLCLWTVFELVA